MTATKAHKDRVHTELEAVGMTRYGFLKLSTRYVPEVVHDNERIGGVVYGLHGDGAALLVATDKRVIFIDRKPLFSASDELSYDVVSGVKIETQGRFSGFTLHTRVGDYHFRFANTTCAQICADYIENKLMSVTYNAQGTPQATTIVLPAVTAATTTPTHPSQPVSGGAALFDPAAQTFLHDNELAVLSTLGRTGTIHGSSMYYAVGNDNAVYMITRVKTHKSYAMFAHHQVAVTITNADALRTLQITGTAEMVNDPETRSEIFQRIVHPRMYQGEAKLPPVTQMTSGDYVVFKVTPTTYQYSDFKNFKG